MKNQPQYSIAKITRYNSIVNSLWGDDFSQHWDHFLTVRCNGCGTLSFCHISKCDQEIEDDEFGRACLAQYKTHYPNAKDSIIDIIENFVDSTRVQELAEINTSVFNTTKLVQLLIELNRSYVGHSYLSCIFLIRAVLDHVPPIFGQSKFTEIANNYAGGGRSFRQHMQHLENSSRKLADSYLHQQIRPNESLPNRTQIEFRADIDALVSEIIRIIRPTP